MHVVCCLRLAVLSRLDSVPIDHPVHLLSLSDPRLAALCGHVQMAAHWVMRPDLISSCCCLFWLLLQQQTLACVPAVTLHTPSLPCRAQLHRH